MTASELPRDRSVSFLVHDVARLFRRQVEAEARAHGVTMPQLRALLEIARNSGISQVALAACIDTDPMTLSGVLDRLEKRGLIERYVDPNDSRAKLARMTASGEELVAMARHVGRDLHERALSGLRPEEREELVEVLRRVRDNLSRINAEQEEAV